MDAAVWKDTLCKEGDCEVRVLKLPEAEQRGLTNSLKRAFASLAVSYVTEAYQAGTQALPAVSLIEKVTKLVCTGITA